MSLTIYFPSVIPYLIEGFEKPLGGAETAVLHLANALRALGVDVDLVDREQAQFDQADFLVVTRYPLAVRRYRSLFERVFFWSPDDTNHATFAPLRDADTLKEFNGLVDGVFAISSYQYTRFLQLGIPEAKLLRTRYGIKTILFPSRAEIPPPICIYTSSPTRGLQLFPKIWPRILARVPKAQLWVYSSMATYRKDETPFNDLFFTLRLLPGVHYFGAVPQASLARSLCRARVFLYPNTFNETASIATLEARAAGCGIVTSNGGALPESAAGNILVPREETLNSFLTGIVEGATEVLTNDRLYSALAQQNQTSAKAHDWMVIANEWVEQLSLRHVILSKKTNFASPRVL